MAIRFYSPDIEAAAQRLGVTRDKIPQMIGQGLISSAELIVRSAQMNLSGPVLKVGAGQLRASVRREDPVIMGNIISIKVGVTRASETTGPGMYGAAWEYGYKVPPILLTPKIGKAMAFMWWNHDPLGSGPARFIPGSGRHGETIAARIMRKAYTIKARPWLRPAVQQNLPQIFTILSNLGIQLNMTLPRKP
jgi:hypothetical protein